MMAQEKAKEASGAGSMSRLDASTDVPVAQGETHDDEGDHVIASVPAAGAGGDCLFSPGEEEDLPKEAPPATDTWLDALHLDPEAPRGHRSHLPEHRGRSRSRSAHSGHSFKERQQLQHGDPEATAMAQAPVTAPFAAFSSEAPRLRWPPISFSFSWQSEFEFCGARAT